MSCATDEVLAAWFAGRVGGAERDTLEAHAASCALCRGVMVALTGIGHTAPEPIHANAELQRVRGENPLRDATALKKLSARNLARVVEVVETNGEVSIAIDPIAGTPLPDWLLVPRTQAVRIKVLVEIGRALNILHVNRLAHGNVVQSAMVVRKDGSAVLTSPTLDGTAAADQIAWWRVVSDVLDRPRSLRRTLRRGLSEDPRKRFPNMDRATLELRAAIGDRRFGKWVAVGVVGVALAILGSALAQLKPATTTIVCAPAAHDWKRMRAPVLAKLAMSGADANAVIAKLDERAVATAQLERATCPQPETSDQHACLLDTWDDFTALFPWLTDKNPEIVRSAVDELAFVPRPESCDVRSHSMRKRASHTMRSLLLRITVDARLDPHKGAAIVENRAAEVEKLDDLDTTAYFHATLGRLYANAGDVKAAKPELDLAASDAASVGDDDILLRALTDKIRIADSFDRALAGRADVTAKQLNNPGLSAALDIAEAHQRVRSGKYDDAISDLRAAKALLDSVTLDAHPVAASLDLALGDGLARQRNYAAAKELYDDAYAIARKRWGESSPYTIDIREARASNLENLTKLLK